MRRSAFLAVVPALLCLIACGRTAETSAADAGAQAVATSAAAVVDAAPMQELDAAVARTTVSASVASFDRGSILDQCVEYRVTGVVSGDAGADPDSALAEQLLASMKVKGKELLRVYKPCDQQFHGRDVLASCTVHSTQPVPHAEGTDGGGGTFDLDIVDRYYELATLEANDVEMKHCLGVKGDWQGLDKTSDAYKSAVQARGRK